MTITIISGSTREGRNSHRLALALAKNLQQYEVQAAIIDLKEVQLQPFTERLQFLDPKPDTLVQLADMLQASDALIFLTPEYNGGISSALKNFIDTFGRAEFAGKPIAVATASTGAMGGIRAAHQLQQTILAIQGYPQPQMLLAAEVNKQLDEHGDIINSSFAPKLDSFVKVLIGFTSKFISS